MSRSASGTTRRSLMKGMAWAAPALTVAVAAPALATSSPTGPPPVVAVLDADLSCKITGGVKRYRLRFLFENTGDPVSVELDSVSLTPFSGSAITFPLHFKDEDAEFALAVGESRGISYTSDVSGDISNGTATASFVVVNSSGVRTPVSQTFVIDKLRPCDHKCEPVLPGENDPTGC